jgi:hypothetical protein
MTKNILIKAIFIFTLFLLLAASNSSPSFSASGCLTPGTNKCNENVPGWVQTCSNCDIDPENEWCNTVNCKATGQECADGACRTNPDCIDNDHDGYGQAGSQNCPQAAEDCDDTKAAVYPGASETCSYGSQTDNNCDGQIGCSDSSCAGNAACLAPCVLTSASWQSPLNIQSGDTATLIINGQNCDGQKEVKFEIWEDDDITADDFVETITSSITFSGNTAQITWPAVWEDENILPLITDNPEYYFKAALTSDLQNGISSPINDAGMLHVSQSGGASQPEIITPAPNSILTGTTQTFSWTNNGVNVTNWGLDLSNNSGYSFCAGGTGATCVSLTGQSIEVSNLPADGNPLRATLWYKENSVWKKVDYQYTAYSGGGAGTATVSWNANTEPDLAGYKVYYGTSPRTGDCPPDGYPNVFDAGNTTSHTFNGLTADQTYYFSVTAYDKAIPANESCFSEEKSKAITLPCSLISAYWQDPKNIQAGQNATLIVNGTNCAGQTVQFEIWESDPADDDHILPNPPIATFSGNQATINWSAIWEDENILPFFTDNPEYYFKAALTSNPQNKISSPAAGMLYVSQGTGSGTATVSWDQNTTDSDLAGYKIYYDTSSHAGNCPGGYPSTNNINVVGNTTSHTFNGLSVGTYYFSVTAYDALGNESSCSAEVSKVIP